MYYRKDHRLAKKHMFDSRDGDGLLNSCLRVGNHGFTPQRLPANGNVYDHWRVL
jgi:hypothetical protein